MGTTKISAEKTCQEIMTVLVASGARQIACDYSEKGKITALRFVIPVRESEVAFLLPARVGALLKHVRNDKEQAERVAWRQLLRWTQAQAAMIEVGMVKPEEVYSPYMLQRDGRTLYELISSNDFKQLAAPSA